MSNLPANRTHRMGLNRGKTVIYVRMTHKTCTADNAEEKLNFPGYPGQLKYRETVGHITLTTLLG